MIGSRRDIRCALGAVVVIFLFGCATPEPTRFEDREVPAWVVAPPGAAEGIEYFVASGSDEAGDIAAAEASAASALLVQLNQAVGIDVSVLTIAEARASADSFEANVREQVTQSGAGRLAGFRVADRYVATGDGRVTVHLLGAYDRAELSRERARREQLVRAQESLFTEPYAEAESAARDGDRFEAIRLYILAAESAARAPATIRSAGPLAEAAMRSAADLLRGVNVDALAGPREVRTLSLPEQEIVFRVSDAEGRDVPRVPIEISLTSPTRNRINRVLVQSYDDGLVSYRLPRPDVAGTYRVNARLSTSEIDQYLRGLPESLAAARATIQSELARIGASWSVEATSRAAEVATTVLVLDLHDDRATGDSTEAGISESLAMAGFSLVAVPGVDRSGLSGDRTLLLQSLQESGVMARRAVVGTASVAEVSEPDGFLVRVRGSISVIDLDTGDVIYATSVIKNARSTTREQAVSVAFYQLGVSIGEELVARLP